MDEETARPAGCSGAALLTGLNTPMAKKGIYSTNPMLGDAQGAKKLEEPLEQRTSCTGSLVQVVFYGLVEPAFAVYVCFGVGHIQAVSPCPQEEGGLPGVLGLLGPSRLLLLILGCLHCLPSWITESSRRPGCSHCSCLGPGWITPMIS